MLLESGLNITTAWFTAVKCVIKPAWFYSPAVWNRHYSGTHCGSWLLHRMFGTQRLEQRLLRLQNGSYVKKIVKNNTDALRLEQEATF